jgi:spore photoproduct lyase
MGVREIRIKKKEYEALDGSRKLLVQQVGDGSIIKRFEKTGPPKNPRDIVCPHFLEFKWANGCFYDCAWCYLQGTYRFHPEWKNGKPNIKDFDVIRRHTEAFLNNGSPPELLNSGELADSLLYEGNGHSFSRFIIPLFNSQNKHKILFLTKGCNVKNLLELRMPRQVILSWTLNALPVAQRWEKRAPRVEHRISAAKKCYDAGYTVRVRIDPIVPIKNWDVHYKNLIDMIFSNFRPERITLGSLRGLVTTINNCKDKSWVPYMTESSGWGKKIDFPNRFKLYSTLICYLRNHYSYSEVGICKETIEMHRALGTDYKNPKCNCVL